jgi:hypothetical protein
VEEAKKKCMTNAEENPWVHTAEAHQAATVQDQCKQDMDNHNTAQHQADTADHHTVDHKDTALHHHMQDQQATADHKAAATGDQWVQDPNVMVQLQAATAEDTVGDQWAAWAAVCEHVQTVELQLGKTKTSVPIVTED